MVTKKTAKKPTNEATQIEDSWLRDYELVLVVSPEVTGEYFDAIMGKLSQFVTETGGIMAEVEQWGKRKLAYPINHFNEGSYVLSRFKLKPTLSKELEANLQISEDILRYLLIKLAS